MKRLTSSSNNNIRTIKMTLFSNRLKKDVQRKEKEKNDSVSLLQEEWYVDPFINFSVYLSIYLLYSFSEHLTKEKKKLEEQYTALVDAKHQRAVEAEVQLLTQRKDSILKPGEQRLQDLERLWWVWHVGVT